MYVEARVQKVGQKNKPAGVGKCKSIKPLGGKRCPWQRERNSVVVQGTK